jgi:hypothetical protein
MGETASAFQPAQHRADAALPLSRRRLGARARSGSTSSMRSGPARAATPASRTRSAGRSAPAGPISPTDSSTSSTAPIRSIAALAREHRLRHVRARHRLAALDECAEEEARHLLLLRAAADLGLCAAARRPWRRALPQHLSDADPGARRALRHPVLRAAARPLLHRRGSARRGRAIAGLEALLRAKAARAVRARGLRLPEPARRAIRACPGSTPASGAA